MHDLILKKIMNNHDINQNLKELYIEWLNKLQLQKNYSFHTIRAYSIDLLNFSSFIILFFTGKLFFFSLFLSPRIGS